MKTNFNFFKLFLVILGLQCASWSDAQEIPMYMGEGVIIFESVAPAETIRARSDRLRGILELDGNTFAFIIPANTFEGFNSSLQKEHFNEHYLETEKFPNSTFTGKMVGLKDCEVNCQLEIFAKGKLTIHGITKMVTIPVQYSRKDHSIVAKSQFQIVLADFNINIPLILEAKISPEIQVFVDVKFQSPSE